jgi:hypothetical protein
LKPERSEKPASLGQEATCQVDPGLIAKESNS